MCLAGDAPHLWKPLFRQERGTNGRSGTRSFFEHACPFFFFFFFRSLRIYIDTNRNYTHVEMAIYTDSDPLRFYSAAF